MTSDGPNLFQLVILRGLQGKNMYEGTVPAKEVRRRRAAGRVAKQSRKQNRSRG